MEEHLLCARHLSGFLPLVLCHLGLHLQRRRSGSGRSRLSGREVTWPCVFHSFLLQKLVQRLPLCGQVGAPSREAPRALQEELLTAAGLCALREIIGFIGKVFPFIH